MFSIVYLIQPSSGSIVAFTLPEAPAVWQMLLKVLYMYILLYFVSCIFVYLYICLVVYLYIFVYFSSGSIVALTSPEAPTAVWQLLPPSQSLGSVKQLEPHVSSQSTSLFFGSKTTTNTIFGDYGDDESS